MTTRSASPTCAESKVERRQINFLAKKSKSRHYISDPRSVVRGERGKLLLVEPHALWQHETEAIEQRGLGGVGLGDAAQAEQTLRRGGQHHVVRLDARQLLQDGPRRVAQTSAALPHRQALPQHEGEEADENVRLHAVLALMPDRPDVELIFLDAECRLRLGELNVGLPQTAGRSSRRCWSAADRRLPTVSPSRRMRCCGPHAAESRPGSDPAATSPQSGPRRAGCAASAGRSGGSPQPHRAAHCERWSLPCSSTIRTARSRTSGENRLEVFFVMAPPSQAVEPPANPGRFTGSSRCPAGPLGGSHRPLARSASGDRAGEPRPLRSLCPRNCAGCTTGAAGRRSLPSAGEPATCDRTTAQPRGDRKRCEDPTT